MLSDVNSLHKNLKFTYEAENAEGKFSFLDMMLIHDEKRISSTWYSKPCNSGLTLNFLALAPTKYKRSVIRSFVHRITTLAQTWIHFTLVW